METFALFDEQQNDPRENTPESVHARRMRYEVPIFDILKAKQLKPLRQFWKDQVPPHPNATDRTIVLVERRIHPNLEFCILNHAQQLRGWSFTFICSDTNRNQLQQIMGHRPAVYLPLFEGSPDRDTARNEQNQLLKTAEFQKGLPAEYLLVTQTDAQFRKPIPEEFLLCQDFCAARIAWDTESPGGGGLSQRKRSAMIRICEQFAGEIEGEDVQFASGVRALGLTYPPFDEARDLFTETCQISDPVGLHQWWTQFNLSEVGSDVGRHFFHNYCHLHNLPSDA